MQVTTAYLKNALGLIYGVNWLMSLPDRRAIRTFLLDLFSDVMDVPGTC